MNIIVADDDKVLSQMICGILRESGHKPMPAFDAMQVMMFAMRQSPDLVLLDISMPGGTGLDVLRKLKSNSKTANVPVIIITGSTDQKLPDEVLKLGASQFLPKPIDPDVLMQAVKSAVA
jgi:two-component system phosphate regulon response regulator PhoB